MIDGKIKPKKSLGQNFLKDKKALKEIVDAADLKSEDKILEIGPGTGLLSGELVKHTEDIILIEKDNRLAEMIAGNFQFSILNFQKISNDLNYKFLNNRGVISGDILDINLPKLIEENDFYGYKVVANIPYYITGKLLRLLLETKHSPKLLVLLLQKEVAQRICAKSGKMSIPSVSVQYLSDPEIVGYVPKESFDPIPKVDSAILKINPKKNIESLKAQSGKIMKLVKMGFSSRRKTLVNNLCTGLGMEKQTAEGFLTNMGHGKNVRAQELSVDDWKKLVDIINVE